MESLLISLLTWIGLNSDYEISNVPHPSVVMLSHRELTLEAYRDQPQLIPDTGIDQRVFALYSWERSDVGTIFILHPDLTEGQRANERPMENPIFIERLLHELVHHVQFHNGRYKSFPCKNAGEKDAYLLGGLYLRQRNMTDPLPNRKVLAHMYSRC